MSEPPSKKRRLASPSLAQLREASTAKLLNSWSSLEAKYCHDGPNALSIEDDDVVDIFSGTVVEDRGVLRAMTKQLQLGASSANSEGESSSDESKGESAEESGDETSPGENKDSDSAAAEQLRTVLAQEKERLVQTPPRQKRISPVRERIVIVLDDSDEDIGEESDDELDLLPRKNARSERKPSAVPKPTVFRPTLVPSPPKRGKRIAESPTKSEAPNARRTPSVSQSVSMYSAAADMVERTAAKVPDEVAPPKSPSKQPNRTQKLTSPPPSDPDSDDSLDLLPKKSASSSPIKSTTKSKPLPTPSPSIASTSTPPAALSLKPCLKSALRKRKRIESDSESQSGLEYTVPVRYDTPEPPPSLNPEASSIQEPKTVPPRTRSKGRPTRRKSPSPDPSDFFASPPPPSSPSFPYDSSSPVRPSSITAPPRRRALSSAPSSPAASRKWSASRHGWPEEHTSPNMRGRPPPLFPKHRKMRSPSPPPRSALKRSKSLSRLPPPNSGQPSRYQTRAPTLPPSETQMQAFEMFNDFMTRMMGLFATPSVSSHHPAGHFEGDDCADEMETNRRPSKRISTPPKPRRRVSFQIDEEEQDGANDDEMEHPHSQHYQRPFRQRPLPPPIGVSDGFERRHEEHYQSPFDFSGSMASTSSSRGNTWSGMSRGWTPGPPPPSSAGFTRLASVASQIAERERSIVNLAQPSSLFIPSRSTMTPVPSRIPRRIGSLSHLSRKDG